MDRSEAIKELQAQCKRFLTNIKEATQIPFSDAERDIISPIFTAVNHFQKAMDEGNESIEALEALKEELALGVIQLKEYTESPQKSDYLGRIFTQVALMFRDSDRILGYDSATAVLRKTLSNREVDALVAAYGEWFDQQVSTYSRGDEFARLMNAEDKTKQILTATPFKNALNAIRQWTNEGVDLSDEMRDKAQRVINSLRLMLGQDKDTENVKPDGENPKVEDVIKNLQMIVASKHIPFDPPTNQKGGFSR